MNRTFFILLIGVFSLANCFGQTDDSLVETTVSDCKGKSIVITIPNGWIKTDRYIYTEGYIQTYLYSNESYVAVLCGQNAELSIETSNDKYLREISAQGISIIYKNVRKEDKLKFDTAFNEMESQ